MSLPIGTYVSADPVESSSLVAAAGWVQGALLGTAATAIAVVAVAGVGLLMLNGRMKLDRGARVIAGCFLLFGASVVARGILGTVPTAAVGSPTTEYRSQQPVPITPRPTPQPTAVPYDPYAGAAVPSG